MKNLSTLLLPCLALFSLFFWNAWQQLPEARSEVSTEVYVGTGSRGADCRGTGICSIGTVGAQTSSVSGYKASLGYNAQGKIFLEFKYSDLPESVLTTQFSSVLFDMQSDCPIPPEIIQEIGGPQAAIVFNTGQYPMVKTSETLRIIFN